LACALATQTLIGCAGGGDNGSADSTTIHLATPFADPVRTREVASIYKAAKARDAATLNALQANAVRDHKPLDPAVILGLLILDPVRAAKDFIETYPTDAAGVMLDYGARLDAAQVTPSGRRYPIAALGNFAAKGDRLALTKLFAAFAVASPPIATDYARQIARVGSALPRDVLSAIATLPAPQELDVIAGADWCTRRPAILSVAAANPAETQAQTQLRQRFAQCPPQHQKKPHKPAHHPHKHGHEEKHHAQNKHEHAHEHAKAKPHPHKT
jgi:hypothetical protein